MGVFGLDVAPFILFFKIPRNSESRRHNLPRNEHSRLETLTRKSAIVSALLNEHVVALSDRQSTEISMPAPAVHKQTFQVVINNNNRKPVEKTPFTPRDVRTRRHNSKKGSAAVAPADFTVHEDQPGTIPSSKASSIPANFILLCTLLRHGLDFSKHEAGHTQWPSAELTKLTVLNI